MSASPGPSSRDAHVAPCAGARAQRHAHAAAGLERRVGGVAHEVDEQLIELVAVGARWSSGGPGADATGTRVSSAATRRTQLADVDRRESRRRQAREPRVRRHEAAERLDAAGDDREAARARSSCQSSAARGVARAARRLPAIDLIGASELLISWPSTRISRCQARRSSSRSACSGRTSTSS